VIVVCTSTIFNTWAQHHAGIWCGNCGQLCREVFIFSLCIDSSVTSIFPCIVLQVFIIWIRSWCSCSRWWVLMWWSGLMEWYNATLCTCTLDLTSRSGFITGCFLDDIPPLGAFYAFHLLCDKQQSFSRWRWCQFVRSTF